MNALSHARPASLQTFWQTTLRFFERPILLTKSYQRENLRQDLLAGLTVAIVMLPQAIAFAMIAELPPAVGLYTAVVGSIVGALWGSSHHLVTGPTNSSSLLVLAVLLPIAEPGTSAYLSAAALLTLMVGVFNLTIGLARMGILFNFISDSVVIGFTAGAGVLIAVNQMRHFLRLDIASDPSLILTVNALARHIRQTHWITAALGMSVLLIVALLRRWQPKAPAPLIAMSLAAAAVALLDLPSQGVQVIGELPRGLPPLTLPDLNLHRIGELSTGALALGMIGLVQTMAIARSIASRSGQRLDSNQEFVGQGLASIACSLFSGYVASSSFSRSAINYESGGRTPFASVFAGLFVLAALLILGPLAAYIPRAALAGVLMVTSYGMINRKEIVRIWHGTRGDTVIMVITFIAMLLLPLQFAVLAGVLTSLGLYILRTSVPRVVPVLPAKNYHHFSYQPEKDPCPQLAIFDILGDLYFGAVSHIEETIRAYLDEHPEQRYLLLRMTSVHHSDISGIHTLESITNFMRERGGDVYFMKVTPPVLARMRSTGYLATLGENHILDYDQAIGYLFHHVLDPAICIYECPHRVFLECQNLPKKLDNDFPTPIHTPVPRQQIASISPRELWDALHSPSPPRVIDVREPREFKQHHIPQAQSLPLFQLLQEADRIDPHETVVFVCRGGRRSTRAADYFAQQGYRQVLILRGGMLAWEAAGLLEAVEFEETSS